MKKFLSICAVILAALGVFAFLSNKTAANKTVFGNGGGQDEFEKAKRISLDVLRDKATRKADSDQLRKEKGTIFKSFSFLLNTSVSVIAGASNQMFHTQSKPSLNYVSSR